MEIQTKNRRSINIWSIILIVLLLGIISFLAYSNIESNKKHKEETSLLIKNHNAEISKLRIAKYTIDSLYSVATYLTKYTNLVNAGYTRDTSRISIPHQIGDIVKLKYDGSIVVISDIIVGGGKFEYYVRYKVINKNRETEEVSPEMVL